MAADEFVATLSEKLRAGNSAVWGEILTVVPGRVFFRRCSWSSLPVRVTELFVVVGGVFSTNAHYSVVASETHSGRYDFVHRLSSYHLNPSTFRRCVEQTIRQVLTNCTQGDDDTGLTATETNDALEFTCCTNGHLTPAWIVRLIPAIRGAGDPPCERHYLTPRLHRPLEPPSWLLLSPPRNQPLHGLTWEISCIPGAIQIVNSRRILSRAVFCISHEAALNEWVLTRENNRFNELLVLAAASTAGDDDRHPLSAQMRRLLIALRERLNINNDTSMSTENVTFVTERIDHVLSDDNLAVRCTRIEEDACRSYPFDETEDQSDVTDQGVIYSRRSLTPISENSETTTNTPTDESIHQLVNSLDDFEPTSTVEYEDNNNITHNPTALKHKTIVNGAVPKREKMLNGSGKVPKDDSKNEDPPRSSVWHCVGVLSLSLVLFTVAVVFLVALIEDQDVMKMMEFQLNKLSAARPEDKHEL